MKPLFLPLLFFISSLSWSIAQVIDGGDFQGIPSFGGGIIPVFNPEANTQTAIDCVWEEWSAWSPCSTFCGGGMQTRSRGVKTAAQNGGKCDGDAVQTKYCNDGPCSIQKTLAMLPQVRGSAFDSTVNYSGVSPRLLKVTGHWFSSSLRPGLRMLTMEFDNGQILSAGACNPGCTATRAITVTRNTTLTRLEGTIYRRTNVKPEEIGVSSLLMGFSDGRQQRFGSATSEETFIFQTYSGVLQGFFGRVSSTAVNTLGFYFLDRAETNGVPRCVNMTVIVRTDFTPEQMFWSLVGTNPLVKVDAGHYTVPNATVRHPVCLLPGEYTVLVGDTAGDGWTGSVALVPAARRLLQLEGTAAVVGTLEVLTAEGAQLASVTGDSFATSLDVPFAVPDKDCVWEDWQKWGPCSAACGGGTQTRSRLVKTEAQNGGECLGSATEDGDCNTEPCETCPTPVETEQCKVAEIKPPFKPQCTHMAVMDKINALTPGLCTPPAAGCAVMKCDLEAAFQANMDEQVMAQIEAILQECA